MGRELFAWFFSLSLLALAFFKQAYMLNYFAMVVVAAWMV